MRVLFLTEAEVADLISMRDTIGAVEDSFRAKGLGKTQMPPKSYVYFPRGDFRAMPAYLEELGAAGVKVVNVHPNNPKEHNLPSVMATILLLDPNTGAPISIMGGTKITEVRTGATGAVAAKYLARKDSRVVAIVGTGVQARSQLVGLREVLKIGEVRVWGMNLEKAKACASRMGEVIGAEVFTERTVEGAVRGADVIVTVTPVTEPLVRDEWIGDGAHINAIGADAPGKEELDPNILRRAKIFVDDYEQALHSGEVNVPVSRGIIGRENVHAELGEVIAGKKSGRTSSEEITVFDSTGLAIHDVATAWMIYEKARAAGRGSEIDL